MQENMPSKANAVKNILPVLFSLPGLIYFNVFLHGLNPPKNAIFFCAYFLITAAIILKDLKIPINNSLKTYVRMFIAQFISIYFAYIAVLISHLILNATSIFADILNSVKFIFLGSFIFSVWSMPYALCGLFIYSALLFAFLNKRKFKR